MAVSNIRSVSSGDRVRSGPQAIAGLLREVLEGTPQTAGAQLLEQVLNHTDQVNQRGRVIRDMWRNPPPSEGLARRALSERLAGAQAARLAGAAARLGTGALADALISAGLEHFFGDALDELLGQIGKAWEMGDAGLLLPDLSGLFTFDPGNLTQACQTGAFEKVSTNPLFALTCGGSRRDFQDVWEARPLIDPPPYPVGTKFAGVRRVGGVLYGTVDIRTEAIWTKTALDQDPKGWVAPAPTIAPVGAILPLTPMVPKSWRQAAQVHGNLWPQGRQQGNVPPDRGANSVAQDAGKETDTRPGSQGGGGVPPRLVHRPPPRGVRERKFVAAYSAINAIRVLSHVTEARDLVDAIWASQPPEVQRGERQRWVEKQFAMGVLRPSREMPIWAKIESLIRTQGRYLDGDGMIREVWAETLEDLAYGLVGRHTARAVGGLTGSPAPTTSPGYDHPLAPEIPGLAAALAPVRDREARHARQAQSQRTREYAVAEQRRRSENRRAETTRRQAYRAAMRREGK